MSHFSSGRKTPTSSPSSPPSDEVPFSSKFKVKKRHSLAHIDLRNSPPDSTPSPQSDYGTPVNIDAPIRRNRSSSRNSARPMSIIQTYQPPVMEVNEDTIPELQPIFSLLNSHSNKLYHEGYFLKLDDQNTQGKPNPDRTWSECFAQLVGTVLSLWDAAELDAAGEDGMVLPKFINLTDASIKVIESLPTRSSDEQPLQNILSLSTAGRNRYLLHFTSHESLIEWTSAVRLAMYEHAALQEAYTGALIAGRAKYLNNISVMMERSKFKIEAWVRVRFGAGVPWRRCWCVITPPDEKEYAKLQKELKKKSPYDRSAARVVRGDIKFYDVKTEGKKQKRTKPVASISEAYSAYAIYPQAKSLVDASTLIKIEGNIAIHSTPASSSEGFVFIMPETRPAVSGFETMLRFLFPTWDTFGLYGRPGRLVASILDARSLMFAMPRSKKYGYLDLEDVNTLLLDSKSSTWNEREWRKRLKEATGTRMNSIEDGSRSYSPASNRASNRISFQQKPRVGFAGDRHSSESNSPISMGSNSSPNDMSPLEMAGRVGSSSSDEGRAVTPNAYVEPIETSMGAIRTPEPVVRPPMVARDSHNRPSGAPYNSEELRRANNRLSNGTLAQMAKAGGIALPGVPDIPDDDEDEEFFDAPPPVPMHGGGGFYAGENRSAQSLNPPPSRHSHRSYQDGDRPPTNHSHHSNISHHSHRSQQRQPSPYGPRTPFDDPPHSPYHAQPPPPPAHGSSYSNDQYASYSPGGSPGYGQHPHRKPLPTRPDAPYNNNNKHQSITPNDIIDHYTTQSRAQYDGFLPPQPPMHLEFGDELQQPFVDRPRNGVLKTTGGADPDAHYNSGFAIPDVNFGPTVNYGAPPVIRKPAPRTAESPVPKAPKTPTEPRPGHRRQESVPWQPATPASPGSQRSFRLTPQQYVQQRASIASAPYGHGRTLSANSLGGHSARSMSPQPVYGTIVQPTQPGGYQQPLQSTQQY
ncbi:SKG3 [Trichoderma harzianum]|uniref:SKG3 n=1 Tax=Trichoderma harzianum TaxID=5544 RepID=A0A0F9XLB1_TRIHA|nr:SKG3 [Trichoderma harzianum]